MIEKNLHFIWDKGYEKMPQEYKENVQSWKKHHPGWIVYFWDKDKMDELVNTHYPEFQKMWNSCDHIIENIDMSKLMILHRYGGLYVDSDIECLRPFPSKFTEKDFVVSRLHTKDYCPEDYACIPILVSSKFQWSREMLNNGFYGAKKDSKLVYTLIQEIEKARKTETKWLGQSMYITATGGPLFITKQYFDRNWKEDPRVEVLDSDYMEPCGLKYGMTKDSKNCYVNRHTVGVHKHQLSWASPMMKFGMKIYYYRKDVFRIVAIVSLIIFIWLYGVYGWNWLTILLIFVFLLSLCCVN